MKKKVMIFIVLLMSVGFAAIATNLFINGQTSINANQDDFDVYYSDAYVNGIQDKTVIVSDTLIEFTTTFESLGQEYVLDYEVTNGSKNYDAELEIECTSNSTYLTVTNNFDTDTVLAARDSRVGKLLIEQTKSYVGEDLTVTIECTIDANAIERTSLNENEIQSAGEYVLEGTYKDVDGNVISNANLVVFSNTPHYVTTDQNGYVFCNGLERGNHEIYYVDDSLENIKSMSKTEIIANAISSATFTTRTKEAIEFIDNSIIESLRIELNSDYCETIINKEWAFQYTGSQQSFIVPCSGTYTVQLWGAQSGRFTNSSNSYISKGAYTSGDIELEYNLPLYIYVGQSGLNPSAIFNAHTSATSSSGGGGATDIRLTNGEWNDFESLKSRIMVAAGAGSGGWKATGGVAGGLTGGTSTGYNQTTSTNYMGKGATQTSGGKGGQNNSSYSGGFGFGGTASVGGGGGGGYYGGGGGYGLVGTDHGAGGGGSSFISGHFGCNAITESSTSTSITHTGEPYHYSGLVFSNTKMIAGNASMPNYAGTANMTGNAGNGYAKITYLG